MHTCRSSGIGSGRYSPPDEPLGGETKIQRHAAKDAIAADAKRRRAEGDRKMYQEVITLKGWTDGSGWDFEQVYSTQLVENIPESLEVGDVWEAEQKQEGGDTRIVVSYYAEEDEERENPLKEFAFWESELFEDEEVVEPGEGIGCVMDADAVASQKENIKMLEKVIAELKGKRIALDELENEIVCAFAVEEKVIVSQSYGNDTYDYVAYIDKADAPGVCFKVQEIKDEEDVVEVIITDAWIA